MKKTRFTIPLILMGMLLVLSGTAIAHEGEEHDKGTYEEGSGGSAMEMDHKAGGMGHEYKEEHGGEHSKEYYEKKYGKYEHEKQGMKEEGSSMKKEVMKMKEMEEHKRKEEGSSM
jgi:hypothetical protein